MATLVTRMVTRVLTGDRLVRVASAPVVTLVMTVVYFRQSRVRVQLYSSYLVMFEAAKTSL